MGSLIQYRGVAVASSVGGLKPTIQNLQARVRSVGSVIVASIQVGLLLGFKTLKKYLSKKVSSIMLGSVMAFQIHILDTVPLKGFP